MGWDALLDWGDDAVRLERLAGGVANDVWSVRVGGHLAVARLGTRSDEDLQWEADLMHHLDAHGLAVPVPIATRGGRPFSRGLTVMTYLEGRPPESEADWTRVAEALRRLHGLTRDWPQRPGWRSSQDLMDADTGTRVDLTAMPAEGVARCRAAWARLAGFGTSVVHGDPNPRNVRILDQGVALLDWDEARVDVSVLDLVLPHGAGGLSGQELDIASQASAAWEAAVCWDDDYSKTRLTEVRPLGSTT